MKEEGKTSKAPLSESFGQWKNGKIVLLALLGLTAGQGVVWYTGEFYALFFLTAQLKVDADDGAADDRRVAASSARRSSSSSARSPTASAESRSSWPAA